MISTSSMKGEVRRLSLKAYLALCRDHYLSYWKQYTLPLLAILVFHLFCRIDVNYTDSLHDHVFLTVKGWKSGLKRGDYVSYRFPSEHPYSPFRKGAHMVKIVAGVEGDTVRMSEDRAFTVVTPEQTHSIALNIPDSHNTLGKAKTVSKRGKPLESGPVGVIPKGAYYVYAPHADSLDSRYAMVGWISETDIIGRTFPLF